MHPEGLMPERVWYDLCSAFSHNPENFRAKRHIFSLFSICRELYGSQSYFSVNLNFPGPLSTGSSEVLSTPRLLHEEKLADCGADHCVHSPPWPNCGWRELLAPLTSSADIIWGQDERHLVLFLSEDLLSYPVSLHSSCIGLVGQTSIASFPVVIRYRSINATAPTWHLIPGHQIARSWGPLICLKLPACISILFLE